ncbi:MAG: sulfotransferase [Kangiellaceae bacterium]|nr:sulfotransferase [Kangiellaceae bacterium]
MNANLAQLSHQARIAVQKRDWRRVGLFAQEIQHQYNEEPEGHFLSGLVHKNARRVDLAVKAFSHALSLETSRYDAAIELSNSYLILLRHNEAFELIDKYEKYLNNSPLYLDMTARILSALGLHQRAWSLYKQANELQPDIDVFRANLAANSVLLGKAKEAKDLYQALLSKYPQHQQYHYELSKLAKAKDHEHIEQMQEVLEDTKYPPNKNIFMYYAIGKELEDLGQWKESFQLYEKAGNAVLSTANYDVANDIKVIEKIKSICTQDWIEPSTNQLNTKEGTKTPIFIVGLPRTGTTLTERIISNHSQVESADETFFMQLAIRHASGVGGINEVTESIIESASIADINLIAEKYMVSVEYRLTNKPLFIDKFPYNFLYLGFIAKAFPNAKIVYLRRNPMDACFAMFKQSFFKFAYSLDNLGRYYVAQDHLRKHWQTILGDRIIELDYESLVADQEVNTRTVLEKLGLEFEQSCLEFEKNPASSATASTLQVREKVHTRSVGKWKYFHDELQPLKNYLEAAGIDIER